MPVGICPNCQERFAYAEGTDDFIHTCNSGKESLDQEDVTKIQETNSGFYGIENKQSGKLAFSTEGNKIEDLNSRGNNKNTTYARQHEEFIEIDK